MSNLTNSTSHFSVTEKVQYALKTALFRTMQTAFGDSGSSEKAAPLRIFPKDIMQTNLVEIGKGDIDDDGYFVSRAMGTGYSWNGTNTLAPLDAVELIVAKYRIIDPTTNIITSIRVETLAGDFSGKTQTEIDNSMPPSGETYPKKNWFFRGHYTGANDSAKFSNANSNYDGLQLAWDKATPNTTATEADIVPHLKYYLQVQTNHTGESDGNSLDNHTYIHDKMKGLVGLESNFTSTISVNRGEGGNCTNLNTTGTAAGEYWFTQATSGTLAFYGVGTSGQGGSVGNSLVNANDSLSNLSTTKFPMISYVRYTGETGFGASSGGTATGGNADSITSLGAKFAVTPVTDGTHNLLNVPSLTGAGNWLEYHSHVDFDFILEMNSPYQTGMDVSLIDKTGTEIAHVHMGYSTSSTHTTASSGPNKGYEGNNVALFVYNPDKKMYEFAWSEYWYNYGNDSTQKAKFNAVIDGAIPTDMIVLNGTGYCSRWMENTSETERLRTHFGSTESPYTGGWSSTVFAGIKGYGKIIEFDTSSRTVERAAAVKIGDIHIDDHFDYQVEWSTDGITVWPNGGTFLEGLDSNDFLFMYNQYGGLVARMKISSIASTSTQVYLNIVTSAGGGANSVIYYNKGSGNSSMMPTKLKMAIEQAGGIWPTDLTASNEITVDTWHGMSNGFYWTGSNGQKYYFSCGDYTHKRRRYLSPGTRTRRDDAWPVGSTRGTNVEVRDTHLTIKKRTDGYAYGNQTRMIEFKPFMSDRWNNSGKEYQPYTVKASINSGISPSPNSNSETGFLAFHTASSAVLDERMRIEHNGNVGIGTTSPNEKLVVNTASAQTKVQFGIGGNDYSTVMYIGGGAENQRKLALISEPEGGWARSNLHFCLNASGDYSDVTKENDSKMVIKNNGNVGIGTTSPDTLLHLSADGSPVLKIVSTNTGSPGIELVRTSYNHSVNYDSSVYADDPWVDWKIKNNGGELQFQSGVRASPNSNGAQTFVDAMSITSGGNVGIGTTSPSCLLNIRTDELRGATNTTNKTMLELRSHAAQDCNINNWNPISIDFHMSNSNNGSNIARIAALMCPTGTTHSSNSHEYTNALTFHTTTISNVMSEKMRINHDGNVGIGTTSPSQKLDIEGQGGNGTGRIRFTDTENVANARNWFMGPFRSNDAAFQITPSATKGGTSPDTTKTFCIEYTGNVGIGTTSPYAKLDVWGPTNNPTTATMSTTSSQAVVRISGAQGQSLEIGGMNSTYNYGLWMQTHNQSSTSNTQYSRNLCLQPVEGNVGIGTASPQTKLDVAGDYSKNGEIISMTSQYGLNAKASIYRKWHREEDSNWGLYWINASSDFDYEDIMAYHATTDTSFTPTTGVTMSQFMSNYSPGDNGENIGSCSYTHGTYAHTTFPISAGRKHNYYSYSTIRTDADAWSEQPYRASGDSTNVMYTGYIKCNETATYYFGWYAKHYYRGLLFIQNPNEGSGKAWNFGYPGWQVNFQCRTNGVDMTAGKYYKFTFLMKGSGYYYYQGAVGMLGWSQSSANWSTPSNYHAAHGHSVGASGYLNATRTIDSVANWQTRFGWISDDSPLQFVKRIPN